MADERSRAEAQRRADRIRAFADELAELQREGVLRLTAEQLSAVRTRHAGLLAELATTYDIDTSAEQKRLTYGVRVATAAAGVALCAALVLLVLRIWGVLPTAAQVLVLVCLPLVCFGLLEFATGRQAWRPVIDVLALMTFGAFVLDVEALARLFAVAPRPEGLLAYGVMAIALAYGYGVRVLLVAGGLLVTAWFAAVTVHLSGGWWGAAASRPESLAVGGLLLAGASLLPHRSRPSFPSWLRAIGLGVCGASLLVLSYVGELSWLALDPHAIELAARLTTLVAAATAVVAGVRAGWPEVTAVGGVTFALSLLLQFVDWWWDWMPRWLFFLVVGFAALALAWVFQRIRTRGALR